MPRRPPPPDDDDDLSDRCVYAEGRRRCRRNGSGEPVLCRAHRLVVIGGLEAGGGAARVVERVERAAARDPLWSTILDVADEIIGRPRAQPAPAPPPGPQNRPRTAPPRPPPPTPPKEDPRTVLGFPLGSRPTREAIKTRQRQLAKILHPDAGGSDEAVARVNNAAEALLKLC